MQVTPIPNVRILFVTAVELTTGSRKLATGN